MQKGENASIGSLLIALIGFILAAATGVMLLITALVVWFAKLTGSMIAATLIVGGICFLLALGLYLFGIRKPIKRIEDRINTVYEVAHSVREAYQWVQERLRLLAELRCIFMDALRSLLQKS